MATINLTIIGLQRLGTSIGLALKRYMKTPGAQHQFVITGSDESNDVMRLARKMEAIDQEVRSPGGAVERADLVILTARNSLYSDLYEAIAPDLKAGAVIVDFSPLKERAIERATKWLPHDKDGEVTAYMVGATAILNPAYLLDPKTDTESAHADLFDKGTLILSPAVNCRGEAIQLVSDLGELLGMSIHFTDPSEHDGMVASMEALPLLANLALFRTLNGNNAWEDLRRLGNPLFTLSTLGLEQFGAEDAAAVMNGNRERTVQAVEALINTLDEIRDTLLADDDLLIAEAFADAIEKREKWLLDRRKNAWDEKTEAKPAVKLTLMSTLASRFTFRGMRPGDNEDDKSGKSSKK